MLEEAAVSGGDEAEEARRTAQLRSFADLLTSGRRLDATSRARLEPLVGHDLGEMVVHDGEQAGRLTRRMQAAAFAIGRRVFAPPAGLVTKGGGLIAHEATHVVQQTAPPRVPAGSPPDLPLARPEPARVWASSRREAFEGGAGAGRSVVQRQAVQTDGATPEAREAAARGAATSASGERTARAASGESDLEALADRVYSILWEDALLERERRAAPLR